MQKGYHCTWWCRKWGNWKGDWSWGDSESTKSSKSCWKGMILWMQVSAKCHTHAHSCAHTRTHAHTHTRCQSDTMSHEGEWDRLFETSNRTFCDKQKKFKTHKKQNRFRDLGKLLWQVYLICWKTKHEAVTVEAFERNWVSFTPCWFIDKRLL